MTSWNDNELDRGDEEMNEDVGRLERQIKEVEGAESFNRVEDQIAANRKETNEGFAEVRSALATLHRTLLAGAIVVLAALIGGQLA